MEIFILYPGIKEDQVKSSDNPFDIEEKYQNLKVIIGDGKFLYVLPDFILKQRINLEFPTEGFIRGADVDNLILPITALHEYIDKEGNKIYSFGNLFGKDSIFLDEYFSEFKGTETFRLLIGKLLKNVILTKQNGQFVMLKYELRD